MAGVLGIIGLALAICVVGALMESNLRKAGLFAAALGCCLVVILVGTKPKPFAHTANCVIDWDGRANSEVCD